MILLQTFQTRSHCPFLQTFQPRSKVSLQATKEMDSARHFKLGVRPKWPRQATPSQPCPSCGETVVPPWRDKSLWRVTSTKTVEGLLSEKPFYESTKMMEEFCDPMTNKHAMEYAKLMKEYEEVKDRDPESENEMKEEAVDRYTSHVIFLMQFAQFISCISHCMAQGSSHPTCLCSAHSHHLHAIHDERLIVRSLSVSSCLSFSCFSLLLTSSLPYPTCTLTCTPPSMSTAPRETTAAPSPNEEYFPMSIYHPPTFGKACEDLSWNHCTSTPHRSETKGIAERAVRRVKEGTSTVLLHSGLDNENW